MKKALSLLLALVMCLSLCACGAKYIGTYEKPSSIKCYKEYRVGSTSNIDATCVMRLNRDGTGTFETRVDKAITVYSEGWISHELREGDLLEYYDLSWEIVDGYLTFEGTGKRYYRDVLGQYMGPLPDGEPITMKTNSYELKGNQLVFVADDRTFATKKG